MSMLLYIMLYIMLVYIMFAALSHAVCFYYAFFAIDFENAFCFHALSWFIDIVCLFKVLFSIMRSAFNLLVFLILCSHHFSYERTMCSLEK